MAYCTNCGTELHEGYGFCPECGQEVSDNLTNRLNDKLKICRNCGEQMPEDAFYCLSCGMTFDTQEPDFEHIKKRVIETVKKQVRDTSVGVWKNKWVALILCIFFGMCGLIGFMRKRELQGSFIYLHSGFLVLDIFLISSYLPQKQIHIE